jgi:MSHA biogenesis protein MshN
MSLINKMLQDLDARGTPKDGALPGQVKPVAPATFGTGRRAVAAAVGGALAALALGALGWKMLQPGAPSTAGPAPVVAPAPAGRSVPVATGPVYTADVSTAAPSGALTAASVPPHAQSAAETTGNPMTDAPRAVVPAQAGTPSSVAPPTVPASTGADADDVADRPLTRAERRAERRRLAAERRDEEAAARRAARAERAAAVRTQDVAPMEPDSAEARAARRAMAQILAGRGTSPKKRSADMLAAARAAAQDAPAPKARHAAPGRQETGAQRAEGEYRRALASLQDGRVTDTIAALEGALKYDPAHEAARQTLVGVLIEAGRTDEAMRQLQLGLTLDARQPALAMLLARLQIERGGSGIETLNRTLPYAGSDPDYHAFLAAALARQGRHREAAEQYLQAVRAAPGNGVWWMGLGISLQAEKRSAEALEAFQKARATGALSQDLLAFVERRIQQLGR